MKYKWRLPPNHIHVPPELVRAAGNRPLLARMLALRGITDPVAARRFLDPDAYVPAPPTALHDLSRGADRIEQALRENERILVWGDFDVDGQTSTALLVEALRDLGGNVRYHIPIRARESHGIRPEVLQEEIETGVDVLLSCDTGIAAREAVDLANAAGVDVVITDHHDLPEVLPDALALINPKFHDEAHPLSGLPGVGVAYKLIEALYTRAGRPGDAHRYLDLAALGIVADLARQQADTRYLLQRGLDVLRSTPRVGLQAIMQNARMEPGFLNDEHIGFQIGPRLNAVGRLDDANVSVPLLTTGSAAEAFQIADELEALNRERRLLTDQVYEAAVEQIRKEPSLLQYAVLVLAHPEWHQGVIGIVASRLVEEYTRPVILLNAPESDLARGSARSVEGYHITQAIATQADLLEGFGGHPMAAGLAIRTEYIDAFRRGVSRAIVKQRIGAKPEPTIDIAGEIELSDLTLETAEELEAMAPFGVGNPPLNLLCRQVGIEEVREIGKGGKHRKLLIETGREPVEVLWWNSADVHLPDGPLDLVVRIRPGVFRGEKSLTVTLQDFYAAGEKEAQPAQPRFECIQDLRRVEEPEEELIALLQAEPDLAIWGEAHALSPSLRDRVKHRFEIPSADALAIWTLPPDLTTLAALLERVRPTRLYVFARDPGLDSVDAFIKRFAGLVRYAINTYRGCTGLANLASALAQTEQVVRAGLEMLPSLGVTAEVAQDGAVLFSLLESPQEREVADLDYLLRETGAFRRLFRRADDLYYFLSLPLEETEA